MNMGIWLLSAVTLESLRHAIALQNPTARYPHTGVSVGAVKDLLLIAGGIRTVRSYIPVLQGADVSCDESIHES